MAAGKMDGNFWHFHPVNMARKQADAQNGMKLDAGSL
jgi:hypothetical protein